MRTRMESRNRATRHTPLLSKHAKRGQWERMVSFITVLGQLGHLVNTNLILSSVQAHSNSKCILDLNTKANIFRRKHRKQSL